MTISVDDVPFLPRGVRLHYCKLRKGWYLLAPERAVRMNDIGSAILQTVDGERSFNAVVATLAASFQAPESQIAKDVGVFLADLQSKRMLEVRS